MKLNPNCIRDILLDIEESTTINTGWKYSSRNPSKRLRCYDQFEIAYQARYCMEAGLISGFGIGGNSESVFAIDLTPAGHEFLSNIRPQSLWEKVLSKGAGASIPVIIEIAKEVALNHYLG